jgi:hypothetical protein
VISGLHYPYLKNTGMTISNSIIRIRIMPANHIRGALLIQPVVDYLNEDVLFISAVPQRRSAKA